LPIDEPPSLAAPHVPKPAPEAAAANEDSRGRVEQLYRSYLKCVYSTDYFKAVHHATSRFGTLFDFAIGLGAAVSGGSGLGILADPRFAWACGIITTVSIILTVAKTTYDWPGKLKFASDMVEKFGRLSGKYEILIDEIRYRRVFNQQYDETYRKLRDEEVTFSPALFPPMSIEKQREIQNAIKQRIDYKSWWRPS